MEDNIYAKPSEAGIFVGKINTNIFRKNNHKLYTRASKSGGEGSIISAPPSFLVSYYFSIIFINFFQNYMIFPGFPGVLYIFPG